MSEKNQDGKRSARDRMAAERRAHEARSRRNKKLAVLGAVIAVIALAVGVGVTVQSQRSKPETPLAAPAGALGAKKIIIPVGSAGAPSTLTVYEDPRCPACDLFEKSLHKTVDKLMDQGKLYGNYHVVSFIDRHDGGSGSKNGANALACAQDAGKFRAYHNVLYANQPDETVDTWKDRGKLISLAKQVPGLDTPAFESCVNEDRYGGWVSSVQQDFDMSHYTSTPTVLLNGESIFPQKGKEAITPANLVKWVDAANKGKRLGTPAAAKSPAASSSVTGAGSPAAKAAATPSAPAPVGSQAPAKADGSVAPPASR